MILVTGLNGAVLALNSDLIERAEATPDTVLTLVDGSKFLVRESVEEIVDRICQFRALVLVRADALGRGGGGPSLHLVPGMQGDEQ